MSALVSGGAGFIASHLIDALLERGNNVLVIDNFSSGSTENLAKQKNNPKLASWTSNGSPQDHNKIIS
ncbi:MAG: NAD-dependent epimerase/dehydratase family protein [Nitrososphaerales archaeon]